MNTAAASTSTDSPPSTLIPNSLLQFQTEIVNESANETPPQEDQSQMDNAAAMNCTIQTLYQYTQQHPHDNDDLTPIPVILANPHGHAMTVTPPQQEQQEAPFPKFVKFVARATPQHDACAVSFPMAIQHKLMPTSFTSFVARRQPFSPRLIVPTWKFHQRVASRKSLVAWDPF